MFQGFYNLTSGMLTQNRNLDIVSNNIANVLTPGFKKDVMASSTFQEEMIARTGNIDKNNPEQLNNFAMLRTATEVNTDYSQGVLESTGNPLDLAITSEGSFFQIQTQNGTVYTRNGSFIIDNEGYMCLSEVGRVLGENGPIYIGSDDIIVEKTGIVTRADGMMADKIALVQFDDMTQLKKMGDSAYTSNAQPTASDANIMQNTLERSNVNALDCMVSMIESQRALQSAAEVLKIYDQLMSKAANDIARI